MENEKDLCFISCNSYPLELTGLAQKGLNGEEFNRLPADLLPKLSEGINYLSSNTSGAMVRFKTNSPFIAIRATSYRSELMNHMPLIGNSGFDFYIGEGTNKKFYHSLGPSGPQHLTFENIYYLKEDGVIEDKMREITINLPLYNGIKELYIGLKKGCDIEKPNEFKYKNVVFYGSSITQGGVASRPGNAYANIISRHLDCGITNLGFSGNAKGEPEMAHYIASLEMDAFVLDYDHNAPTLEYLMATHHNFYKIVREKHPNIPIVMVTKPDFETSHTRKDNAARRDFIKSSYEMAVNNGDKNVYFVDGETLFGDEDRDACTVDTCHPNDVGFLRMANVIGKVLKESLENK